MKKTITFVSIALLLVIGAVYFYPKKYNKTYNGIMYRIGDNTHNEKIQIVFDGEYYNRFFKKGVFRGNIIVGDKKLSNVELRFYAPYKAMLTYYNESHLGGEYVDFGIVITDNLKKHFCIGIYESNEKDTSGKGWSSDNGLIISAPARDISEADGIAKELLNKLLN